MATTIKINFARSMSVDLTGWNKTAETTAAISGPTVVIADLLDSLGAATGASLIKHATSGSIEGILTYTGPWYDWPPTVWEWWVAFSTNGLKYTITNLNPGDTFALKISGMTGQTTRPTTFIIAEADDPDSQTYYSASATVVDPPVEFAGTVPANGILSIEMNGSPWRYINGLELTLTPTSTGLQPPTNLRVVQISPTETRLEWDAP